MTDTTCTVQQLVGTTGRWWVILHRHTGEHPTALREPVAAWALLDDGNVVAMVASDCGALEPAPECTEHCSSMIEEDATLRHRVHCDCGRPEILDDDRWCRGCGEYAA